MSKDEIHVGDIGTTFRRTVQDGTTAVDISGATVLQIHFRKPHWRNPITQNVVPEEVVKKTAVLTSGGTDGILEYVTIAADLDRPGKWHLQVYIVDTGTWYSDWEPFDVFDNLVNTVSVVG